LLDELLLPAPFAGGSSWMPGGGDGDPHAASITIRPNGEEIRSSACTVGSSLVWHATVAPRASHREGPRYATLSSAGAAWIEASAGSTETNRPAGPTRTWGPAGRTGPGSSEPMCTSKQVARTLRGQYVPARRLLPSGE